MKKEKTGNALIFAIVITTIVAGIVGSMGLYTYGIFFRVNDIHNQVYISLEAESLKNKQFLDYITDPINFRLSYDTGKNIDFMKFSRYVKLIEDQVLPGEKQPFFMTDIDVESSKVLSKVKKLAIYYQKTSQLGDLKINFLKFSKTNSSDIKIGTIYLSGSGCVGGPYLSGYNCRYILNDFSDLFQNNGFSYVLFFSSETGVSYAIEGWNQYDQVVDLPSRYLEQEFSLSTNHSQITKTTSARIDLYEKFNININTGLYNTK